ncbi:tRNA (adenosine(37)-N6)-threonylcarbamoyltransferase complex dimerization subunit type 1 TsaB [Pseudonocardia sp. EV170527-09]|uniref:tRNA (adenosine(37)-N6)-threonylcarbamoyltransferase complex dimerization subunit type 1 TsaB n=1 Tax=Pseudonocardia sp. EV170527-09 TaxID=2603411 RepID=UPI0011F39237|nr:tRNA (adenosine(37)-N6)-threonylcarbamoyltransferase complex dimerization subunit type 1 TsaB [Pseudonocardia sp. EV170527-09]KAA1031116.1 tRNA (adenosine(37)-N6)-threonylcarbamoyltransferase complex dimerization subunit type 1 TsaB [Pseudonocardia sp. EV170527-09]
MLVLALDTATTVVTAGLVDLRSDGAPVTVAARAHDGRRHGELLMPAVRALCAEAGRALTEVEALVVGAGPGPFTGLRVGIASAAALGHALDVPVHGVATHDAIASWVHTGGNLLVVTDARRREVYWAAYDASDPADARSVRRLSGPAVEAPEALAARLDELAIGTVIGDPAFADRLGRDIGGPGAPTVEGLVGVAAADLLAGRTPAPVEPLYLRRPDAVEPTGRKRVTA